MAHVDILKTSRTAMNQVSKWRQALANLSQAWNHRNPRERTLLTLGSALVALAALWSLGLSPAIQTWREAPDRQAQLDGQSQNMLQLIAQVQELKKTKPITRSDAVQWLEKSVAELGPNAKISVQGDRATLSLVAATPEALSKWIGMARELAMSLPVQAQLKQAASPPDTPSGSATSSRQNQARLAYGQPQNPMNQPGPMGQPGIMGQPDPSGQLGPMGQPRPSAQPNFMVQPGAIGQLNQYNAPPASVQGRGTSKNDTFWSGTLVLRLP